MDHKMERAAIAANNARCKATNAPAVIPLANKLRFMEGALSALSVSGLDNILKSLTNRQLKGNAMISHQLVVAQASDQPTTAATDQSQATPAPAATMGTSTTTNTTNNTTTSPNTNTWIIIGVVVVALIVIIAVVVSRNRNNTTIVR